MATSTAQKTPDDFTSKVVMFKGPKTPASSIFRMDIFTDGVTMFHCRNNLEEIPHIKSRAQITSSFVRATEYERPATKMIVKSIINPINLPLPERDFDISRNLLLVFAFFCIQKAWLEFIM
jgi:hypothetical protein